VIKDNRNSENVLELQEVDVSYGELQILKKISLKAIKGQVTVILGSNGAGKTTLLKGVSGLARISSGNVVFGGQVISELKPWKIPDLGIAHVPEGRGVFPQLRVLDNIRLGAYTKRSRAKMKENFEWAMELFPVLRLRRKQLAGTMSGGEQQMIAIARGLMADPKLLILDEPSLGLMPLLVKEVFEVIKKINLKGVTILLVEQNVRESMEICDWYYVLESGSLVHDGAKENYVDDEFIKSSYLGM
jgi:branched-chain amino acid transport system ATP-binding protein